MRTGRWLPTILGLAASLGVTAAYNYFFIPPVHTFRIADPRNWVALAAFLLWSLLVTGLVVTARNQAAEAERRRLEGEASSHIEWESSGLSLLKPWRGAACRLRSSRAWSSRDTRRSAAKSTRRP